MNNQTIQSVNPDGSVVIVIPSVTTPSSTQVMSATEIANRIKSLDTQIALLNTQKSFWVEAQTKSNATKNA